MSIRKMLQVTSWPDPLLQERMEEVGFYFDPTLRLWLRFCDEGELDELQTWLQRKGLRCKVTDAPGRGQVKRLPKLSDILVVKSGGGPSQCALCGVRGLPCRLWLEGDDTDSVEYPGAARFYMCGQCVQTQMQPHPRLYVPADECL